MSDEDKREQKGGVEFLAKMLGIHPSSIYAGMRRGDPLPPCLQIGTRKIWRRDTIIRWIEENERQPKADPRAAQRGAKGAAARGRKKKSAITHIGRPTKASQIERRGGA